MSCRRSPPSRAVWFRNGIYTSGRSGDVSAGIDLDRRGEIQLDDLRKGLATTELGHGEAVFDLVAFDHRLEFEDDVGHMLRSVSEPRDVPAVETVQHGEPAGVVDVVLEFVQEVPVSGGLAPFEYVDRIDDEVRRLRERGDEFRGVIQRRIAGNVPDGRIAGSRRGVRDTVRDRVASSIQVRYKVPRAAVNS